MVRPWAAFHNTPIFGRISLVVLGCVLYTALVVVIEKAFWDKFLSVGAGFHGFIGLVLGVLLVFRTNTSYDRWWEGRKLWGQLINDSRNLAIKVQTCVRADPAEKTQLGKLLIGFAYALRDHLRGEPQLQSLPGFAHETDRPAHLPAYLSARIYSQLENWRLKEQLGGFELLFLDQHASSLMNISGACERIQSAPISLSYRWFIRQSIAIYLITMPWAITDSFGYWSIGAVGMLAYFMIGLEIIAEEIEDPFGLSDDDLKLDEYCQTIERSVTGILLTA
jgi:putative membrane protein